MGMIPFIHVSQIVWDAEWHLYSARQHVNASGGAVSQIPRILNELLSHSGSRGVRIGSGYVNRDPWAWMALSDGGDAKVLEHLTCQMR